MRGSELLASLGKSLRRRVGFVGGRRFVFGGESASSRMALVRPISFRAALPPLGALLDALSLH
jgi:hypothetical protein